MGRPVVHWELWSKNPEKVASFYSRVFDWNVQHIPEMNYRLVETGGAGGVNGGIMTPQEGPWPGNMALYVDVDDLAAYRKRVVEAGGEIIVEEMAVPGMGSSRCSAIRTGGFRVCGSRIPRGNSGGRPQPAGGVGPRVNSRLGSRR